MTILTGCLLLLASIAGHTEYWVMLVNRTHSLGISYLILKAFRKLHDLAVVLFAAFVIWKLGVCPNGLLTGGTFAGQPRWAQNLLLFTIPGTIPLIVGILRWHLVMKRDFHRTDSSRTYDVSAPAVTPSAGNNVKGTRMHLSRLFPLNEIYHLQINEKSVHLSGEVGSSSEFRQEVKNTSPIRIVHFSDLHFVGCPGEGYYQWLFDRAMEMKPDVFAFTGDLIDDPTLLPLACRLLKPLTEIAPCFFVLGNHDWRFDSSEIRKQVEQTGWIDVSGNAITLKLADRNIVICGTERPW
ncbi:MAG: metallophosphoesterase, partial [Planctomycetaceae bacterium]|nr:metallophosphoesterase [Planctomycetaceae bacterium]